MRAPEYWCHGPLWAYRDGLSAWAWLLDGTGRLCRADTATQAHMALAHALVDVDLSAKKIDAGPYELQDLGEYLVSSTSLLNRLNDCLVQL